MALDTYKQKRDFSRTPEPAGRKRRSKTGASFVVQKHAARRLHYDFRLEKDGVLLSWAVTRGPSLVAGEKRLAVHVEDHPLEYGGFEGSIPKGEYGGGEVIVWDRGEWTPTGDADRGLCKGHLEFELKGEKLCGRWHLVRMAGKPKEKRENWLLIKGDDDFARQAEDPDILEERPESVLSGRTVEELHVGPKARVTGKKAAFPGFVEPRLATLRRSPPSGADWLHEIKFDGYRLQAHVRNGEVRLFTRSGHDWTGKFGDKLVAALAKLPVAEAIVDGELVVEGNGGASDFSLLQADLSQGRSDRFTYYAFDLLFLDGRDLRKAPLTQRKQALEALVPASGGAVRFSRHFEEQGEMVLDHACRLSLEGVVSKRAASAYGSGRSKDWIKSKCTERQEFVIAGYVPSSVSGDAIGSLVLGYHKGGKLLHAGRVGSGFSQSVALDLKKRLGQEETAESPFAARLPAEAARGVLFVRPKLVAEVEFAAWTAEGSVRHAAFRGLREDKSPDEVTREDGGKAGEASAPARPAVRLTHPDRIYWKDAGVTKSGLADYYAQAWPRMAPFVVNRPLSLLRCPNGAEGQCFFQKHAWKGQSREILLARNPADDSREPNVAIDGLPALLGLVQGGALEIHPWGSSLDDLEKPDIIVMDLDPGEGVAWPRVADAALDVRRRLEAAGLVAFLKTTGGKGLHVAAPLEPSAGWNDVKAFCKKIADDMGAEAPDRYVATVTKARRKGRILIDYLRNGRGATAVAPWSTRARAGAPVSMPVGWDELPDLSGGAQFTVSNAASRLLALKDDPWEDFRRMARPLPGTGAKTRKKA